ncbi:MAG: hypothetical protein ACM3Q4_13845 [Acidobacteriota bacterium]
MRSLIIITVVVITFITVSLILPFRQGRQPDAPDMRLKNATASDTAYLHSTQHAESMPMSKTDTVRRQSDGTRDTHKPHASTVRSTSLL